MPAADQPIHDFDDVQLGSTPPTGEDTSYPPPPGKKKSKKKKAAAAARQQHAHTFPRPAEEEEAPALDKEMTLPEPSPPSEMPVQKNDQQRKGWYQEEVSLLDDAEDPAPAVMEHEAVFPEPDFEPEYAEPARSSITQVPQQPAAIPRPSPRLAAANPAPKPYSPRDRPGLQPDPRAYAPQGALRQQAAAAVRRGSGTPAQPRFVEPVAPPHKAQPHFYTLPDLNNLGFGTKKEQPGKAAGSDGYCCVFDSFADAGDAASASKAKNVLLVGSEGGLEVIRILPNKCEVVGRLEGLRGSVIAAKILPHTELYDIDQPIRPLVAVIVHGAMSEDGAGGRRKMQSDHASSKFQTTVEVYSLQTQQLISTLYKTASVGVEQPAIGQLSTLPGPIGDLRIDARGRFITLASGKSGEIFVFSNAATPANPGHEFRCIGKFWTTLQRPVDQGSRPQSSSDGGMVVDEVEETPGVPLLSLSHRWLAFVAPSSSSHLPISGSPLLLDDNQTPPGLSSHLTPPQPPISCDVTGVDAEGTWGRLTRQAAQGLVKYSQKGIEMGRKGWNEFTNPTTQPLPPHVRTSCADERFPPTKGPPDDPGRLAKEPAIVSIVDLETLLDAEEQKPKYPPPPLATFALEDGCNFLSFSSNGLKMLTVSRTGELSTIWDLMQASHGAARHDSPQEDESEHGPCIKQIQRIPRSSQSVAVDCAWTRDDDYVALLTTHGTVHLHEIAARPSRKRKRRSTVTAPPPMDKADPTVSLSQGMSPPSSNGLLGSIRSGWQQVSTQVNTMRTQNPVSTLGIPTTFAGFKETAAHAGSAGRRALAKGISQGYSAAKSGASEYWHSEDNKIRHKAFSEHSASGSLRWVKRQSGTLLVVACGGTVHLHPVQRIERRSGDVMVSGLKHDKYGKKHFDLPPIRTSVEVNGVRGKREEGCAAEGPHGFWSLKPSTNVTETWKDTNAIPSQAYEVETNPPYCPLHIDPRVNFCAFEDPTAGSQSSNNKFLAYRTQGHGLPSAEPWLFGADIPPSVKMNTHEGIVLDEFAQGITDSEMEGAGVQSQLTVMSTADHGSEQITIRSMPVQGGGGSASGWGDGETFGYDDDDGMM